MSESKLRCYLQGQQSLLIHCAEALLEGDHTICGVITALPQIVEWAGGRGVPVLAPGEDVAAQMTEAFDYFLSIGNLKIVPPAVLAKARGGAFNFHDGPLPAYAGLNATAWALINREPSHGITWHVMTDGVDEGEIVKQRHFDIGADETSFTLNTQCYGAAIESFGELLSELASGTVQRTPQAISGRTYFGLADRPAAAATLRWPRPAAELEALVRALDFGPVDNPLATAKIRIADELLTVASAKAIAGDAAPGTIIDVTDTAITVGTGEGALELIRLSHLDGAPAVVSDVISRYGLTPGGKLPIGSDEDEARISEINGAVCRHEPFWVRRLEHLAPVVLPYRVDTGASAAMERSDVTVPAATAETLVAGFCAFIARVTEGDSADVGYSDPTVAAAVAGGGPYFRSHVPMRVALDREAGFEAARGALDAERALLHRRGTYAADVWARHRQLRAGGLDDRHRVTVEVVTSVQEHQPPAGAELAVVIAADGGRCVWHHDPAAFGDEAIAALRSQFATYLAACLEDPARALAEQPLMSPADQRAEIAQWNDTAAEYDGDACVHQLFATQAKRTPDATALAHLDQTITYRDLDRRANQLAHHLQGLGVGPDVLVGVCVERSIDMMVATLGVMKAGGAYVPMDPAYPKERIALMLSDSGVTALITQEALAASLPPTTAETVLIDTAWGDIAEASTEAPNAPVTASNLAYAIYTSGSTGKPKAVLIEHRNVVNFFAGMDRRLGFAPGDAPGTWLAVTSLSFDISVLELFWTLARGFKVVLHADKGDDGALLAERFANADKPITFSLMYFASDEGENETSGDKYNLLIEGAKFGDANGFAAVWTPERHFHAFGGLYPNPSVAAAALATITERIQLRAASVVMPLHHPIRVAEEWALVDNLSKGRVGISFAAGWQPNDFVIYKPERFEQRKAVMLEDLETVRRLWRGETLQLTSPLGKTIDVRTLPRPVQPELPFWLTAAGNPETFRAAGEIGANLLTHLLGQTREEVAEKIAIYREAWRTAGHRGRGQVTLMLHTFVGPDADEVKATVRGPMKSYLESSVQLIKAAAWTFPTFKQKADATGKTPQEVFEEEDLSREDLDAVLEHAFTRYYATSGLFGTPQDCAAIVDGLKGIDVDDVGCLLDYGVPSAKVLEHLAYLKQVKDLTTTPSATALPVDDLSLAAQVERHQVTHLQCTPSQMSLILAQDDSRAALRRLKTVMVGGEAFGAALARDLRQATAADILNMYGPTETTIWSCTDSVRGDEESVAIGTPIANTQVYLLDSHRQPVPVGSTGELYIAGDGVARGYHQRPDLTAERFVANPFSDLAGSRMYRTGDVARYRRDGVIEFLGRVDHQVKLRGYRIELGEIEAHLAALESVRDAVVIAREDVPGDKRLVAYVVLQAGATLDLDDAKARLKDQLPEHMMPSTIVRLDHFPLTPNAKIDRKALPAPDTAAALPSTDYVKPSGNLEEAIAGVWTKVLNVEKVGIADNFFDLGGHSLLAVQAHRQVAALVDKPLSLTDLFRFPTIRALVDHLQAEGGEEKAKATEDRAAKRKAGLSRRAKLRSRRRV